MSYALDTQLRQALAAMRPAEGEPPPRRPVRGDWEALRAGESGLAALDAMKPAQPSVGRADHHVASHDGAEILLRWYTPAAHDPSAVGPAVVYLHGGGMVSGSVALFDRLVAGYAADSGVPFLSVDYRRAPEHPHPAPAEDGFAGLTWLAGHAAELGVDPARIALMGESAGGGLAAAATLLARTRGLPVARQILVYPMLDDRTTEPDPALLPFAMWSYDDNHTGWHALLGDAVGGPDVPGHAAPAREEDLSGLPPAYIEVGELDIFRDEDVAYARRLAATGTSVELHVHPGCPHAFDHLAPGSDVARRARADRLRVLAGL
ncbi:alpha/beta hydrolase [Streptomyces sp. NPDC090075]|uniref:alpha/beta hydrolase n=1 Tax=Streptomyces sp. NPDC090075 TaxID=3365937 RepID=UPI003809EA89